MDMFSESKLNPQHNLSMEPSYDYQAPATPENLRSRRNSKVFSQSANKYNNLFMAGSVADGFSPLKAGRGAFSPKASEHMSRSAYKKNAMTSIISARNQQTLDSIKDPLLRIKRSVERFGRDMIDIVQKEVIGT